jgi:hypothetical protein
MFFMRPQQQLYPSPLARESLSYFFQIFKERLIGKSQYQNQQGFDMGSYFRAYVIRPYNI